MASLYSPLKIVLVGSSKAGKSCLAQRWVHNDYDNEYVQTLGADMTIKLDPEGYVNLYYITAKSLLTKYGQFQELKGIKF
jgi:GTPase SAR1 family protein